MRSTRWVGELGNDAPICDSVISRLRDEGQIECSTWMVRDLEPVYMWIDGVYVKAARRSWRSSPNTASRRRAQIFVFEPVQRGD